MKGSFQIVQKDGKILNVIKEYIISLMKKDYLSNNKENSFDYDNLNFPIIVKKNSIRTLYSFTLSNQDILPKGCSFFW